MDSDVDIYGPTIDFFPPKYKFGLRKTETLMGEEIFHFADGVTKHIPLGLIHIRSVRNRGLSMTFVNSVVYNGVIDDEIHLEIFGAYEIFPEKYIAAIRDDKNVVWSNPKASKHARTQGVRTASA